VEVGNVQAVLDGELDEFVRAELLRRHGMTDRGHHLPRPSGTTPAGASGPP
jgi:hypothetical protein